MRDGSPSASMRREMPIVEAALADMQGLLALARNDEAVSLVLEPSTNEWLPLFRNWLWITVGRVLPSLLGFTAGVRAYTNLRAHVRLGGASVLWPPTRPVVVLVTEMLVCPVLGVSAAGGVNLTSDVWSTSTALFMFTGLTGFGLFTTLLMAVRHACASHPRGP